MLALGFNYCIRMITAIWSLEWNHTDPLMKAVILEKDGGKVTKGGCKMVLLDESHHCRAVSQLSAEIGCEWTKCQLHFVQDIYWDSPDAWQAEKIKNSGMTNTSTAIVHMDCTFLSVMKAVLNYAGAFGLQCGVSFAKVRIKDIVNDMISSQYPPEQSISSHIR